MNFNRNIKPQEKYLRTLLILKFSVISINKSVNKTKSRRPLCFFYSAPAEESMIFAIQRSSKHPVSCTKSV